MKTRTSFGRRKSVKRSPRVGATCPARAVRRRKTGKRSGLLSAGLL